LQKITIRSIPPYLWIDHRIHEGICQYETPHPLFDLLKQSGKFFGVRGSRSWNLKNLLPEAIIQITQGITEAQEKLSDEWVRINPKPAEGINVVSPIQWSPPSTSPNFHEIKAARRSASNMTGLFAAPSYGS